MDKLTAEWGRKYILPFKGRVLASVKRLEEHQEGKNQNRTQGWLDRLTALGSYTLSKKKG